VSLNSILFADGKDIDAHLGNSLDNGIPDNNKFGHKEMKLQTEMMVNASQYCFEIKPTSQGEMNEKK
jgi:hypothetical protein